MAIISVTVQLWTKVFWVISVYFNIRNTLPKSGTFLLGHLYKREVLSHGNHVAWIIEAVSTNDVQEKLWFMSQPNRIFFFWRNVGFWKLTQVIHIWDTIRVCNN